MIEDYVLPKHGDTLEDVIDNWALTNEQKLNGIDYINTYFTKEEAIKHGNNLCHYFSCKEDVAFLKMMLISLGVDLKQVL